MIQLTHPGDKSKRSIDFVLKYPPLSYSKIIPDNRKTNQTKKGHSSWLHWTEPTQLTLTNMALEETSATVMLGSSKLLSKLKTFLYNSGIFAWKEQTLQVGRYRSWLMYITWWIISEKEPLEFHIAGYSNGIQNTSHHRSTSRYYGDRLAAHGTTHA